MPQQHHRQSGEPRGGGWVIAQMIILTAVIVLGVMDHSGPESWVVRLVGAIALVMGAGVGIAGVRTLGRNLTPFPQPREDAQLVESGIYGRVRHPLYTSVMLLAFGWALVWQSITALLAALVLVGFFQAKARREERALRSRFAGYIGYERRVPRFLPRLGRKLR